MTHVGSAPVSPAAVATPAGTSFVEWGAVFAGAVLAAALSFVFLTFGTAIGLSATSPWPNSGLSAKVLASLAIFWTMAQQIGAFMAGGYVAGRMRSRWGETTAHEVDFRDGLHGGLVWAVGVTIGALLFFASAGATAKVGAEAAGQVAATASANQSIESVVDAMLRPMTVAQAAAPTPPGPAGATATGNTPAQARAAGAPASTVTDGTRAEIARLIASSVASGSMTDQNRAYLAQLLSQRTGLSPAEADKRVADAITQAREAADKARRAGMLAGFVTAASLIVSFGAAWWAAVRGGNHRDNSIPARFEFGHRRRVA